MITEKEDIEINGTRYKKIRRFQEDGTPHDEKNQPRVPFDVHASGAHLIFDNPERNHFDHYKNGKKWIQNINQTHSEIN